MCRLNYDLWQLQQGKRDGSHGTRRERSYALAQMANTLHEKGFPGLRAWNLKGRHVEALVRDWFDRGLADATMMNRMAHLRWWAKEVGKPNIVGTNAEYGIGRRSHVSDGTKRRDLDMEKLALVKDEHVGMALRLQAAFGLRREGLPGISGVVGTRARNLEVATGCTVAKTGAMTLDRRVRHTGLG